jgi:hypothetical protein
LLRRAAILLALLLPLSLLTVTTAHAGAESEFVARANGARTSRGIRAYVLKSDLTAVARRQAARMAAQRRMYHNPNLTSEVSGWRNVGENVGRGPDVASIHNAFMGSASHRANILSTTFTEIGVGTARASNGELFVSQVFRRPTGASYTAPAPRTAPRPVYQRPARASRSGVRRPVAPTVQAPRRPAKKRVVIDRNPRRLKRAVSAYRYAKPADPLDRMVVFVHTNALLGGLTRNVRPSR